MQITPNTVLAITGPTASGKTALSLAIATMSGLKAEIISADSRQIFKGLDIGTAKPTAQEMAMIPHHCIDICEPDESFNAGMFAKTAHPIISNMLEQGILPIIVGGSGLYVQALCEGFFDMPADLEETLQKARAEVQSLYEEVGKDDLFEILKSVDPQSCIDYPDKNPRRIMRALEFHKATGALFSEEKSKMMLIPTFETLYVMIEQDRSELYARINDRCEDIWEGTVRETSLMLARGINEQSQSLDTVGYAQAIAFLHGEIDEKTAIDQMKQATRNYAKRQLTWSKRVPGLQILKGNTKEMADQAIGFIRENA